MKQLTRIYSRENHFNVDNNMEKKYERPIFFSIVTDSLLKWINKRDLRYLSCQNIQSLDAWTP